MKRTLAPLLLVIAGPAMAEIPTGSIPTGDIPDGQGTTAPQTASGPRAEPTRSDTPGRQTARTAYGYRLTAPEEDEDPTDRRVLRRLNTRLNSRLETRIERYTFVDTKSDRTGTTTRNPYDPRPAASPAKTDPVLRKRQPEDPR